MPTQKPEKAQFLILDGKKSGKKLDCLFNPSSLSQNRSSEWGDTATPQRNTPERDFSGGKGGDISFQVLFDTTVYKPKQQGADDVRRFTDFLQELTQIDPSIKPNPRPPQCQFIWGKFKSFKAYLKDVKISFTMFGPDGRPIRAKVDVTLIEAEDPAKQKGQNPTSRSEARKVRTVVEGETLDWIAYQEYGDPAYWRHIAETNDLADPRRLRSGQTLKLTPLP